MLVFLLISKDELKYPRGSFSNNPNFYPFGQQHFPRQNNSKPSPQIFRYIQRDRQDFAHILNSLISNPLFQISNPIPGGPSQLSLDTNQYLKFSLPLSVERPSQNLVWLLPVLKISIPFLEDLTEHFQFPQLFLTSNPSHSLIYGSKGIWAVSRHHWCSEILPDLGLKS